ncbi:unnamed protein product [Cylindrotheca closterium]|uniref:Uncharacterized protein n=1 Tax=Cylindrotheca closterium TaxID=2856 RepID=A0AAD2FLW2_9STRA|nr:unnamed protein product [Cylindrotheca closterium]
MMPLLLILRLLTLTVVLLVVGVTAQDNNPAAAPTIPRPSSSGGGSGSGGGIIAATTRPSMVPTMPPSESPSSQPTNMPSNTPTATTTMEPTESPSTFPTITEPFLFQRPLQKIQLRLVGALNVARQDELLDTLQGILQTAFYDAMVDSFLDPNIIDDSDGHDSQTDKDTNATAGSNNSTNTTMRRRIQQDGDNSTNNSTSTSTTSSILYKVSLEWTFAKFQVNGDPFVHILQASGTLGFTNYDYVLLHPQTILPLQQQVMGLTTTSNDDTNNNNTINSNNNNNTHSIITVSQIELALRRQGFFFQILEFQPLLDDDDESMEPSATKAPTPWKLEYDDDDDDDLDESDRSGNQTEDTALDTIDTLEDDADNYDDDDDGDEDDDSIRVSNKTIGIVLIVVCTVSTLAFGIFLRYVCQKSKQIKEDRLARSQALLMDASATATKKKDQKKKKKKNEEEEEATHDTTVQTSSSLSAPSPIMTVSMASGAPTPVSSAEEDSDRRSSSSSNRNKRAGSSSSSDENNHNKNGSSFNLPQRLNAVVGNISGKKTKEEHFEDVESDNTDANKYGVACSQLEEEGNKEPSTTTATATTTARNLIPKMGKFNKKDISKQFATYSSRLPSVFRKEDANNNSNNNNNSNANDNKGRSPSLTNKSKYIRVENSNDSGKADLEAGQEDCVEKGIETTDAQHESSSPSTVSSPSKNNVITRIAASWRLRTFRKDGTSSSPDEGMELKMADSKSMDEESLDEPQPNGDNCKDPDLSLSKTNAIIVVPRRSVTPKSTDDETTIQHSTGAGDKSSDVEKEEVEESGKSSEGKDGQNCTNDSTKVGVAEELDSGNSSMDNLTESEEASKDENGSKESANETASNERKEELENDNSTADSK